MAFCRFVVVVVVGCFQSLVENLKSKSGSALKFHVIWNCGSGVFALPEELIGVMGRAASIQVQSSFTSPSGITSSIASTVFLSRIWK